MRMRVRQSHTTGRIALAVRTVCGAEGAAGAVPKQIGDHERDQRPDHGRHGAAACVHVDVTEAEKPDGSQRADEQASAR
jgi:hypothetical protein